MKRAFTVLGTVLFIVGFPMLCIGTVAALAEEMDKAFTVHEDGGAESAAIIDCDAPDSGCVTFTTAPAWEVSPWDVAYNFYANEVDLSRIWVGQCVLAWGGGDRCLLRALPDAGIGLDEQLCKRGEHARPEERSGGAQEKGAVHP